jgi:hypothetical protein
MKTEVSRKGAKTQREDDKKSCIKISIAVDFLCAFAPLRENVF